MQDETISTLWDEDDATSAFAGRWVALGASGAVMATDPDPQSLLSAVEALDARDIAIRFVPRGAPALPS